MSRLVPGSEISRFCIFWPFDSNVTLPSHATLKQGWTWRLPKFILYKHHRVYIHKLRGLGCLLVGPLVPAIADQIAIRGSELQDWINTCWGSEEELRRGGAFRELITFLWASILALSFILHSDPVLGMPLPLSLFHESVDLSSAGAMV